MTAREGFDDFVAGRSPCLLRLAYVGTLDAARAETAVLDVLAELWHVWPTLDGDPEAHARAAVLARTLPRHHTLQRHLADAPAAGPDPPAGPGRPDDADQADRDQELWRRFAALTPRDRALTTMRHVDHTDPRDTEHALGAHGTDDWVDDWAHHGTDDWADHWGHRAEHVLVGLDATPEELARAVRSHTDAVVGRIPAAAVHDRVATTRRRRGRRTAAVALAAGTAVAVLVAPSVLAGDDEPPPPTTLAGHEIPATLVANGFTYDYAQTFESEDQERELTVDLPRSDTPRLVVWASSAPKIGAFVATTVNGRWRGRHDAGSVEAYEYLPPGPAEIELTQSGVGFTEHLGVAVYTLAEAPPGVSDGRTTFRAEVLGERLVAGVLGRPGESSRTVDLDLPDSPVRVAFTCYGTDAHEVRVSLGSTEVAAGPCTEEPEHDPGAIALTRGAAATQRALQGAVAATGPGETSLGVRLADPDGAAVNADGAVVGAALYTDLVPRQRVAGIDVPRRVELDGHTWQLAGTWQEDRRDRVFRRVVGGPREPTTLHVPVVGGAGAVSAPLTWDVLVDTKVVETVRDDTGRGGVAFSPYLIVPEGDRRGLEVAVTTGADDTVRVGFVDYERVDLRR